MKASVKKEFSKFSDIMGKAQKHIQTGLGKLVKLWEFVPGLLTSKV